MNTQKIRTFQSLTIFLFLLLSLSKIEAAMLAPETNVLQPIPRFVYPDISNNINTSREPYVPEVDLYESSSESEAPSESLPPSTTSTSSFLWWKISGVVILVALLLFLRRKKD
jgi:hypothetical protein